MTSEQHSERLSGLLYSKLFPNPAEPARGLFVAEQMSITRDAVDWRVIAPVPWVPRALASARRPYVSGDDRYEGVPVARPRYLVAPRRIAYTAVAGAMAASAKPAFEAALAHDAGFVHAHTLYPAGAAALRNAAGRLPVIVTVHGSDLRTNLARPAWRAQLQRVASDAAAIVCVSSSLARELAEHLSVDPAKLLVIPNSFDDTTFTYEPASAPALGSAPAAASAPSTVQAVEHVRLVSVGNLVPVKGFDVLLEALALAVAEGLDASLTLIGEGSQRARLEQRAAQADLAGRVTFAGNVDRQALLATLRSSELFVSPSRQEGFGVALVEALATGLPAVATASGGPNEILGDSAVPGVGSGVLVPAEDPAALARGISDAARALGDFDRAAIARDAHDRFGRAAVAARLVTLYREVVMHGGPQTGTLTQGDA